LTPTFKRFSADDVQALQDVADDVFDNQIDPERAMQFLDDHRNILIVALEDNRIIGQITAVVHQHLDAAADVYIDNLGVTPNRQRRGIATQLIALALDVGRSLQAEAAWVAVDTDNAAARELYGRTGATGTPILMFSYAASSHT
jgi:ribosomal protein S18 acetylase RimI-like enzyme